MLFCQQIDLVKSKIKICQFLSRFLDGETTSLPFYHQLGHFSSIGRNFLSKYYCVELKYTVNRRIEVFITTSLIYPSVQYF